MQILIETFSGSILNAMILNISASVMRVAIPGCDDAVDLWFDGGVWFWEGREPVQVHFYKTSGNYHSDWFGPMPQIELAGVPEHKTARPN